MKNFIPLIIAILFIGAGCVFEKPVVVPEDNSTESVVTVQTLVGVVTSFESETKVSTILLADGSTEQVQSDGFPMLVSDTTGSLYRFTGERDPSTRIIRLSDLEDLTGSNLMVVSPITDATVISPLVVTGFGRVFEQTFAWRIKDSSGVVVEEGHATTNASDVGMVGPFSFEVFLPLLTDRHFTLEVFEYSAKDGSEQNIVSVPLNLLSTNSSEFSIWLPNSKKGSLQDCTETFPVKRTVAQTSAIGRAAISELLKGPTDEEKQQGYFSQIPGEATLQSLVISDHVAKADFSAGLDVDGGSCRVQSIRSQIVGTLLQFETVESVTISVDGNVSTALQP